MYISGRKVCITMASYATSGGSGAHNHLNQFYLEKALTNQHFITRQTGMRNIGSCGGTCKKVMIDTDTFNKQTSKRIKNAKLNLHILKPGAALLR